MPTTIATTGRTVFFPDAGRAAPSIRELQAFAEQVHPSILLVFPTRLVRSVRRRRRQVAAAARNGHWVVLARGRLERALRDREV